MKKLLQTTRQRIDALAALQSVTLQQRENVVQAGQSHGDNGSAQSAIQVSEKWANLRASDAFSRGKSLGYANACNDFLGMLDVLASSISSEAAHLEELFVKMESFIESEPEDDASEDDLVPLGLGESSTD